MLKSVLRGITESGTQEWLLDRENGCLFLLLDLYEQIIVHSVSGIYGDHSEPQYQKWCIFSLIRMPLKKKGNYGTLSQILINAQIGTLLDRRGGGGGSKVHIPKFSVLVTFH